MAARPFCRYFVFAVLCAPCLLWTARPLAQSPSPVFRSGTELVRLDVTITDRRGRPVDDVRAEEIQISENGRRRPIMLFRHLVDRTDGEEPRRTGFDEVSQNERSSSGHLYVLVFDQVHLAAGHEQRVRQAAERFLSRDLKPGDAVAIYGLPGPGPAIDFTSDLIRARARLQEMHGQAGRMPGGMREYEAYRISRTGQQAAPWPEDTAAGGASVSAVRSPLAGSGAASEVMREQAAQVVARADTEAHVFLSGLAGVMRRLRAIDGRKAFVLFSEGFFVDNLAAQLEQVASAAAQSNSVVYSIDVNSPSASDEATGMLPAAGVTERRDPLARLATETNGRLVMGPARLEEALSQIAAETHDCYLVGFEPSGADARNSYHRVKVNVTRPGLVVRARTGYSTSAPVNAFAERQVIDAALTVPRTSSAIPIAYTTYERVGERPDRPLIIASMTAHLPASRTSDGAADVVFVVRDAVTGQAVASGTDQLKLTPSMDDTPGRLAPIQYAVQFDVPPGEYWMRMLVREPGGVIGTADRRFHVWPIDSGVTTSDLIVARLAGARFDPPSEAVVRAADDVLAYVEVYGAQTIRPADAVVEVVHADQVVATADALVKPGSRGETIVRARLPVSALAEGQYAARVRIVAGNQPPRTVMRTFRVVRPEPSAQ